MSIIDKAKNIGFMLFCNLIWTTIVCHFIQWLTNQNWPAHTPPSNILAYLFFTCLCAPAIEELLFRHLPFQAMKLADKHMSEANYLKLTWIVVVFTSLIFGLAHGNGWTSVLIQGVGGFALAYTYLKNGYSYTSSVIQHSLWNILCLFYSFY